MAQFNTEHIFGGIHLIRANMHPDKRGFFHETFNVNDFADSTLAPLLRPIQQINHSFSKAGVVRGMHFQRDHPQAKLVSVTRGAIIDFVQDIRLDSPTYGRSYWALLDDHYFNMLYVPRGFSHGFVALKDSDVVYFCDDIRYEGDEYGYNARPLIEEYTERWTNLTGFNAKFDDLIISDRDKALPEFVKEKP